LTDPKERVASLSELFQGLARVVRQNLDAEEDVVERQRLALNASKELRSILADIAAEAGGRGGMGAAEVARMDDLSEEELERLIKGLRADGE